MDVTLGAQHALEFLKQLHPKSPRYRVHGIYKERGKLPDPLPDWWYKVEENSQRRPASMHNTFVQTEAQLRRFLTQCAATECNAYYSINRSSEIGYPVKLKAEQITHVDFLHFDYDVKQVPPTEADPVAYCKAQMRAALPGLLQIIGLEPAFVVFSGGGLQLLFRLSETLVVDSPEEAAGYNKALADQIYGADSVHDISRIFRLPGSTNFPGAEKLARGRLIAKAEVWHTGDATVDIRDCKHATVAKPKPGVDARFSDTLPTIADLRDVIPQHMHEDYVVERLILLAEHGYLSAAPKSAGDVLNDEGFVERPDRNRWDWDFVCQALRCGLTDDQIAGFLLMPVGDRIIGEHCRAQADPLRAVARCIERAQTVAGVERGALR